MVLMFIMIITACSGGNDSGSGNSGDSSSSICGPVSVSVNPANPVMHVGTTHFLTATGKFPDGTSHWLYNGVGSIAWKSSNESVVTVNGSGSAQAIAAGEATITASYRGNISGSTTITVTSATLSSISINPTNPVITAGNRQTLTVTGTYSDGTTVDIITDTATKWNSSNGSVATVLSGFTDTGNTGSAVYGGIVTGKTEGTVTITATISDLSASMMLTILEPQDPILKNIYVSVNWPSTCKVSPCIAQAIASGKYSDGTEKDITNQITWSADCPTSISSTGEVTIAHGWNHIRASLGNVEGGASKDYIYSLF